MNNENINEIPAEEIEVVTQEVTEAPKETAVEISNEPVPEETTAVEETPVVEETVVTEETTVVEETPVAEETVVVETAEPVKAPQNPTFAILSIVFGCLAFLFNPIYICVGLSVGFGVGGFVSKKEPKTLYLIGMIIGIVAGLAQLAFDFLVTLFTFGLGFFTFLI